MTETKFTPGPWSIERYGDGSSLVIHSDEDNRVCFMATASSDRPTSHAAIRANARLIAAAPALYEALKEVTQAMTALTFEGIDRGKGHWPAWDKTAQAVDRARSALLLANTGGTENG
jgi:hypothetical protein